MLKKDVFHWEEQQTWSFQQIKSLIAKANDTPLRYYDRTLPVTVQADTSLRGLGACLIQQHNGKDQPIAFASKSLTDVETRYANIERELLVIVFACQCFSTYLLRRRFIAERLQAVGDDCHEEPRKCTTPFTEDVTGASEIQYYHQVPPRESDATSRRTEPLPGKSITRNQAGYEGRLHSLHEAMD